MSHETYSKNLSDFHVPKLNRFGDCNKVPSCGRNVLANNLSFGYWFHPGSYPQKAERKVGRIARKNEK